ncbi:MAG: hypothetical protein IIA61_03325 [Candidatus Marinimicrobia bacterium]|nr:hypothetical protein [Candidatus Neomarinimicrobiota bacterium]
MEYYVTLKPGVTQYLTPTEGLVYFRTGFIDYFNVSEFLQFTDENGMMECWNIAYAIEPLFQITQNPLFVRLSSRRSPLLQYSTILPIRIGAKRSEAKFKIGIIRAGDIGTTHTGFEILKST